jgi:hypothetical protein
MLSAGIPTKRKHLLFCETAYISPFFYFFSGLSGFFSVEDFSGAGVVAAGSGGLLSLLPFFPFEEMPGEASVGDFFA